MKRMSVTTRWIRLGRALDEVARSAIDDGYEVADFVMQTYREAGVEPPKMSIDDFDELMETR